EQPADQASSAPGNPAWAVREPSVWSRPAPAPQQPDATDAAATSDVARTAGPGAASEPTYGSSDGSPAYLSPTAPVTPVRPAEWTDAGARTGNVDDGAPGIERYTPAPELRPD